MLLGLSMFMRMKTYCIKQKARACQINQIQFHPNIVAKDLGQMRQKKMNTFRKEK